MKNYLVTMAIIAPYTIIIALMWYNLGFKDAKSAVKYTIDLPEEYMLISDTSTKPDSLISWISGDTLHFRFTVAARNFPNNNH